jgi:hypothetical protein
MGLLRFFGWLQVVRTKAIEGERSVSLAEHAHAGEISERCGKLKRGAVLRNHEAPFCKKRGSAQEHEDPAVVLRGGVWRIKENDIEDRSGRRRICRDFLQPAEGIESKDGGAGLNVEGLQVLANQGHGRNMIFDEDHFTGAAAEGFDADSTRTGEGVDKAGIGNAVGKHIEKGLAQPVACGSESESLETLESAAAKFPGDHTHIVSIQPQPM